MEFYPNHDTERFVAYSFALLACFLYPYDQKMKQSRWLKPLWIVGGILVLFLNLCAGYYGVARRLFMRDAGRKLSHLDGQLSTPDAVLTDLHRDLTV